MKQAQHSTTAGVDVGKRALDVAIAGSQAQETFANAEDGRAELVAWLCSQGVTRVGLEASGGYERAVREALEKGGLEVVLHQPAEVRLFARLKRIRAKNDRIDARVIALATAQVDAVRAAQDPELARIADRMTAYEYFAGCAARAKTFLEQASAEVRPGMQAHLRQLQAAKAQLLRELLAAIRRSPELARRFDLLRSLPGVGPVTAAALVARMPELGSMRRGQAASLLGVAPFDRDSGTFHGKRFITAGRARPRRFVYLAALTARRCDTALKAFSERLLAHGKPPKVVLVAIMRKLIEAANLVLARGAEWRPST